MPSVQRRNLLLAAVVAAVLVLVVVALARPRHAAPPASRVAAGPAIPALPPNALLVTPEQARSLRVQSTPTRAFASRQQTVGYIDFNQEQTVPVFSPWAGRIVNINVKNGDMVQKGQTLYTINSPDLITAESTLISSASSMALTSKALDRAQQLLSIQGIAQRDVDQSVSDHATAQGNYTAARQAVELFGKSPTEINRIIGTRRPDGLLVIASPLSGKVTARNAAPGLLVQPGNAPAPVTVANTASMWMVANVPENMLAQVHVGDPVDVSLEAYPGRTFDARIANIGAAVDASTHTIAVRAVIQDPRHELLPQMLATFSIETGAPVASPAVPLNGVVREGDGTVVVFTTRDHRRFDRREVKTGLTQGGFQQILAGLAPGEQVVTDGALFLSNALALQEK